MSIALKNEVRALGARITELELKLNKMNTTPRTVAGTADPDPVAPTKKRGRPAGSLNKKTKEA